ncbi:hypothetical protein BJP27_14910 [Pseudomonas oryzihabitans]|nr:hypothetical protein BJP27_14910 [Pseudomonas psychrotolerans]
MDAMVKADPNLAWIKQAEQRGDIDWRQVKEVHDSFKYSHSGLSGPAAMAIAIVVAYFTAGAASAAIGNLAGAAAGSGSAMAAAGTATASAVASDATVGSTVAAGWANAAAAAALTSMASSGAVSLINNRGNIGATLKETLSSDGLKNAMIAAGTAGFMSYASSNWFKTTVDPVSGKVTEESVIEYDQYGRQVKRTDYTNHGYGDQGKPTEYHSDPHTYTYEYGPGYGVNGKETRINND